MDRIKIINHRGLNAAVNDYYPESTEGAFRDQLQSGFGLEFDPQLTKEGQLVVIHDASLKRLTQGRVDRLIKDLTLKEVLDISIGTSRLLSFRELMALIQEIAPSTLNAIHIKAGNQHPAFLDQLLQDIQGCNPNQIVLFDLKIEAATYLHKRSPDLALAPSVANPYDIERYNQAVGETLFTIEEASQHRNLFTWVWCDEWDRRDRDGKEKTFYNAQTFERLRNVGYKIALVTPELHASSPGLLGGESHPDASTQTSLFARFKEIVALKPDAMCTDYTSVLKQMI